MALTARQWVSWLFQFALKNKEQVESLQNLAELVSKLILWPLAASVFVYRLWPAKKDEGRKSAPESVTERGAIIHQPASADARAIGVLKC